VDGETIVPALVAPAYRVEGTALSHAGGGWAPLAWDAFGRRVRHAALGLAAATGGPGTRVGIPDVDSADSRVADVAALAAGCVTVGPGDVADVVLDAGALRDVEGAGAGIDDDAPDRFERMCAAVTGVDPATVVDGVVLSHANLCWTLRSLRRLVALAPGRRVTTSVAIGALAGRLLGHYLPIAAGASVVVADNGAGADDADLVVRSSARWAATVSAPGAAAPSPVYGVAACTGIAAMGPLGAVPPGAAGRPLPGVTVAIDDDGRVLVAGGNVAATAGRWVATGDTGKLDRGGWLWLSTP
jgi:long-subunit acyl-CoA synthetase (AMP-forming)